MIDERVANLLRDMEIKVAVVGGFDKRATYAQIREIAELYELILKEKTDIIQRYEMTSGERVDPTANMRVQQLEEVLRQNQTLVERLSYENKQLEEGIRLQREEIARLYEALQEQEAHAAANAYARLSASETVQIPVQAVREAVVAQKIETLQPGLAAEAFCGFEPADAPMIGQVAMPGASMGAAPAQPEVQPGVGVAPAVGSSATDEALTAEELLVALMNEQNQMVSSEFTQISAQQQSDDVVELSAMEQQYQELLQRRIQEEEASAEYANPAAGLDYSVDFGTEANKVMGTESGQVQVQVPFQGYQPEQVDMQSDVQQKLPEDAQSVGTDEAASISQEKEEMMRELDKARQRLAQVRSQLA